MVLCYNIDMDKEVWVNERIKLVAVSPDFAVAKYNSAIHSRDHLLPWLSWVHYYENCKSPEEGIQKMRDFQISMADEFEKGLTFSYDIFYDGKFAGNVAIVKISRENNYCEIGYWLDKDFIRKGIMTNAVNKITEMAFSILDMHCVSIQAAHKNLASRAVAERCDFKLEATLREQLLIEGVYYDRCVYTKLVSD